MAATDHIISEINKKIERLVDRQYDRTAPRTLDPKVVLTPTQYKAWQRLLKAQKVYQAAYRAYEAAKHPFITKAFRKKASFYFDHNDQATLLETREATELRLYGNKVQREAKIKALKELRAQILMQGAAGEIAASTLRLCKQLGVL